MSSGNGSLPERLAPDSISPKLPRSGQLFRNLCRRHWSIYGTYPICATLCTAAVQVVRSLLLKSFKIEPFKVVKMEINPQLTRLQNFKASKVKN